jgi:hypothetical protein
LQFSILLKEIGNSHGTGADLAEIQLKVNKLLMEAMLWM